MAVAFSGRLHDKYLFKFTVARHDQLKMKYNFLHD
jgi:hypothetical protein